MDIIFLLRREDGDGGTKKSFVFSGKKKVNHCWIRSHRSTERETRSGRRRLKEIWSGGNHICRPRAARIKATSSQNSPEIVISLMTPNLSPRISHHGATEQSHSVVLSTQWASDARHCSDLGLGWTSTLCSPSEAYARGKETPAMSSSHLWRRRTATAVAKQRDKATAKTCPLAARPFFGCSDRRPGDFQVSVEDTGNWLCIKRNVDGLTGAPTADVWSNGRRFSAYVDGLSGAGLKRLCIKRNFRDGVNQIKDTTNNNSKNSLLLTI